MKWRREVRDMLKDPTNVFNPNTGAGTLYTVVLEDEMEGKEPFNYSTMIFIPRTLSKTLKDASLQNFFNTAETELLKKHKQWRGRTKVVIKPLARLITN